MGETIDHTMVNPDQLRLYGMTLQDKAFAEAQIFIATEDHDFIIPLSSKGTIIRVTKITPTDKEIHTYPHVTCLSSSEWDPQKFRFTNSSRTVDWDIARNVGAVMTEGGSPYLADTNSDINSVEQIYGTGAMTSRMIGSVKVASIPSRNVSVKKKGTICAKGKDVPVEGTLFNRFI